MNKIVKDSLILFAITAIAGLLLAFVNEITKDPIEQQKIKAKQEACKNVFEDAASFQVVDEAFLNDMQGSFKHKFAKKPEVIDGNMAALRRSLEEVKGL